jgi:hypothetical protein
VLATVKTCEPLPCPEEENAIGREPFVVVAAAKALQIDRYRLAAIRWDGKQLPAWLNKLVEQDGLAIRRPVWRLEDCIRCVDHADCLSGKIVNRQLASKPQVRLLRQRGRCSKHGQDC